MLSFGIYNLCHALSNAILLMYWTNSKKYVPHIFGIALSSISLLTSIGSAVVVCIISQNWNEINNSSNSFYYLHKSVFIGDISNIQRNLRIEFISNLIIFSPLSIYLIFFWGRLLHITKKSN